ncbi:MAG: transposase [Oscillospiraceae bacterium]
MTVPIGEIYKTQIDEIQRKCNITIDKYVIMPNHIHLIIVIAREEQSPSPTASIIDIVCSFKSLTTKSANIKDKMIGRKIWQRSFHDRIIRNEQEYQKIWEYIDTNPMRWEDDCFYPL